MSWLKQNWIKVIVFVISIATVAWPIFYNSKEIYLYAWERQEDFSFLKENSDTTVVFYAGGVLIDQSGIKINRRISPIKIPDGIKSFPLVRIDNFDSLIALNTSRDEIVSFITNICQEYKECQIDFEAKASEYEFYKDSLSLVAKNLPKNRISITGLASWCSKEGWFDRGQISEVIPMLYRLGPSARSFKDGEVKSLVVNDRCSNSAAISMDELDLSFADLKNKDIYIFNPKSWTEADYKKITEILE